ncbi:hypothetical protein KFE80_12875 [bacterium SCSIO 12696]|nr:hypothetical protein KFE80_12875 [bacterium SCSIO 12696]
MVVAFCIQCGHQKSSPHQKCRSCGFKAVNENDVVKSVWLSTLRTFDLGGQGTAGEPEISSLKEFAMRIKEGVEPKFPDTELALLLKQYKQIQEKTIISPLWFGLAFLLIPIIAIVMFIWS